MADYVNNKIRPEGWLKKQLEIQAKGLSGNLDKVWKDVRDSAWIGGNAEGWERVPYWLDGFIPLAYLLEDEDMKARANHYMNAILDRQQPDGWLCPGEAANRSTYDSWAHILISKVLTLYIEFTHSERAKNALYRATKCYYDLLSSGAIQLFEWGKYRWFEEFITLNYLYEETKEDWILELGRILRDQGADYKSFTAEWVTPKNEWKQYTHIVNMGMMFKYESLTSKLFGEEYKRETEALWDFLSQYHATAVGTFNGDECLAGSANNRGAELCSVVELMYSCEWLYQLIGNPIWADRLEKAAFNALPATISDDMWTHQYDQQVNQIGCVQMKESFFATNDGDSNLFGLEPNFGCCTANFNQGWPKLALYAFLKTEKGVHCPVLLPARLETEINGVKVTILEETDYPFDFASRFTVKAEQPVDFELKIRIPGWAKNVQLDGKPVDGYLLTLSRTWQGEETLTLTFEDTPRLVQRADGLYTAQYGPLVFSLPIEYKAEMHEYVRKDVVRKFPYCDYELFPQSEWRYGFAQSGLTVEKIGSGDVPFSAKQPAIKLKAKMARVDWDTAEGQPYVAAELPKSVKAISPEEERDLLPYGCCKLRMTEMPLTEKE